MTFPMFVFGLLTVVSALGVVFFGRPLYSALSLVVTLFLVAINFALLGAQFLAATQIMVYAGAIMVLVVFVIMLLGLQTVTPQEKKAGYRALALGVAVVWILGLSQIFRVQGTPVFSTTDLWKPASADTVSGRKVFIRETAEVSNPAPVAPGELEGTTENIGGRLFTKFVYPFEVVSALLLAAIIGATVIAYENKRALPLGRGLRAKQEEKIGQKAA